MANRMKSGDLLVIIGLAAFVVAVSANDGQLTSDSDQVSLETCRDEMVRHLKDYTPPTEVIQDLDSLGVDWDELFRDIDKNLAKIDSSKFTKPIPKDECLSAAEVDETMMNAMSCSDSDVEKWVNDLLANNESYRALIKVRIGCTIYFSPEHRSRQV